jgi:hypothetical protein
MLFRAVLTFVFLVALQAPAFSEVIIDGGGRFETLLGLRVTERDVVFEVVGLGEPCTRKDQFHVERYGEEPVHLILIRDGNVPGECRHNRIFRQAIAFSFRELGLALGERLVVINPVEVNEIPEAPRE